MKVLSRDRRKYLIVKALRELEMKVDNHIQMALPAELYRTQKTGKISPPDISKVCMRIDTPRGVKQIQPANSSFAGC